MHEERLVCKNIFLNIFEHNSEGHNVFLNDISVTLINRTDAKNNIKRDTGNIPSKRWHLMVLMLKMIFKSQLTCIYLPLVLGTDLPLVIIVILVIASVIL